MADQITLYKVIDLPTEEGKGSVTKSVLQLGQDAGALLLPSDGSGAPILTANGVKETARVALALEQMRLANAEQHGLVLKAMQYALAANDTDRLVALANYQIQSDDPEEI